MREKKFQNQTEYLKHKKRKHAKLVKHSKFIGRTCNYGNENCWFRDNDKEIIRDNEEVVQGILRMM